MLTGEPTVLRPLPLEDQGGRPPEPMNEWKCRKCRRVIGEYLDIDRGVFKKVCEKCGTPNWLLNGRPAVLERE